MPDRVVCACPWASLQVVDLSFEGRHRGPPGRGDVAKGGALALTDIDDEPVVPAVVTPRVANVLEEPGEGRERRVELVAQAGGADRATAVGRGRDAGELVRLVPGHAPFSWLCRAGSLRPLRWRRNAERHLGGTAFRPREAIRAARVGNPSPWAADYET